jgi:hypothetical protein
VNDRHRFGADSYPDPDFHADADPDPDPYWYQNDADKRADPTLKFTHVRKSDFFIFLVILPVNNVLSFSSVSKML